MQSLRELVQREGVDLVGVADLTGVDDELRRGYPRAISLGIGVDPEIVAGIVDGPTEAYCKEYDRLNGLLTATAGKVAAWLFDQGHRAEARPASGDWDRDTLRAPFPHKTAVTRAGLGWIGKCALAVNEQYGSAVRWSTVLTDAPLPTGEPVTESQCKQCMECVHVCPGQACSGKNWQAGMPREEFWNPHACLDGMEKINEGRDNSRHICGMCIAACPYTRDMIRRSRWAREKSSP